MNNIKTIALSLILFAAVIGALIWFNGENNELKTAAINNGDVGGILTADETNYDFGNIGIKNGLITHKYILENMSGKMVKIGEVSTSCMCTSAKLEIVGKIYGPFGMPGHGGGLTKAGAFVNPGEKVVVEATFDPAAHGPAGIGEVLREIYIDTGAEKPIVLGFKVNVTP